MNQLSTTTIQDDPNPKNRKLRLTRTTNPTEIPIKPLTRLKSNHEEQKMQTNNTKLPIKPRSSIGKRPVSSRKMTETANSVATTCSAKSQQQVKEIIGTVFTHSKKLQTFISQKNLNQHQAYQSLINNQLFTLSLIGMVTNKTQQQANKYVQRSCIHKLDRFIALEKQKNICEEIQSKIGDLIEKRIKALSLYS